MLAKALNGVVVLLVATLGIVACGGAEPTSTTTAPSEDSTTVATVSAPATTSETASTEPPAIDTTACSPTSEVVEIVHAENPYAFQPDIFEFEQGKTYCLTFTSPGTEFHTFNVDDPVNLSLFLNPGETLQVDFTPDTTGTFKVYCVPHESQGMVGEITVR